MMKNTKETDMTAKLPKDVHQKNVTTEQMKIVTQHFTIHLFRIGKNFKKFYQRRAKSRNAGTQGRDHKLTGEDEM